MVPTPTPEHIDKALAERDALLRKIAEQHRKAANERARVWEQRQKDQAVRDARAREDWSRSDESIVSQTLDTVEVGELTLIAAQENRNFYVYGTNFPEIFESIKSDGIAIQYPELSDLLVHEFGNLVIFGLTYTNTTFTYDYAMRDDGLCWIDTGIMEVDIEVYLPIHENPESLTTENSTRWNQTALYTQRHEQVHVSDVLDITKSSIELIQTLSGNFSSCALLDDEIRYVLDTAYAEKVERANAYHESEEFRIFQLLAPFEKRLDLVHARLMEIHSLYPNLVLPQPVFDEYNGLVVEYDELIEDINWTRSSG